MKRILTFAVPAALLALAGCGGDTCTSAPAPLAATVGGRTCNLAPGQVATFSVQLCGRCTDTAQTCQAEFVNGQIEVSPVVQQCQTQAGCGVGAECAITPPVATCQMTIPAGIAPGTNISVQGEMIVNDTLQIGSGTSCTL